MLRQKIAIRIEEERENFLHWVPLFMGTGIGVYFSLDAEPTGAVYLRLVIGFVIGLLAAVLLRGWAKPAFMVIATILFGFLAAGARAHLVAAPVLTFHYYGPVEGRIVKIEQTTPEKTRLTLDRLRLDRIAPENTPKRAQLTLLGAPKYIQPEIGLRIATTAFLSGPNGPAEPRGFDFRRLSWFRGVGAVGYSRTPVFKLEQAGSGLRLTVSKLRMALAQFVRAALPEENGAFAVAITTGQRAQISQPTMTALRGSNLAHLLAISGLHMGLLTGFVFQLVRVVLSLISRGAWGLSVKKIAACVAILTGGVYLALSGGNVATERAFIMVSTMFVAMLLDRRALTLRSVVIAAIIVLLLRPEALTQPGFQLSFAATTALISVFSALRHRSMNNHALSNRAYATRKLPKWLGPVFGVALSSFVAGMATAPFGAAHFNQISHYGVLANLLSVPVMGLVIMPLAVVTVVLAPLLVPLGLADVPLKIMGHAIDWILGVAHFVSSLEGATSKIVAAPSSVVPLLAVAGIFAALLKGKERIFAVVPLVIAMLIWGVAVRPGVLISQTGGLVGVMASTGEGRSLSKARGDGFAARMWLGNDGDQADQEQAFLRTGFSRNGEGKKGWLRADIQGLVLIHLTGRGARGAVDAACREADVVVTSLALEHYPEGCEIFDKSRLSTLGAVALSPYKEGYGIETTRALTGQRLWTGRK